MRKASKAYKQAMSKDIRDRAYIKVTVGIVNNEAQKHASTNGTFTNFSNNSKVFKLKENYIDYASYEQNYWLADGSQYLLPRNSTQYLNTDITTQSNNGKARITFNKAYEIRGLTITFAETSYPTKIKLTTSAGYSKEYDNTNVVWSMEDNLGYIEWFEIEALEMVGGYQRLHIHEVLCGIGILFDNNSVEKAELTETINPISSELPTKAFSVTVFDYDNVFNVEDDNSYINYLEQQQTVRCLIGMTLDTGRVEWLNMGYTYLKDWKSSKGKMQFNCSDLLEQMNDEYSKGDKIYTRTAYSEVENIIKDLGYEEGEYFIDNYLKDVELENPLPGARHSECLQLLANACRCIIYQNTNGFINVRGKFDNFISDDVTITSSNEAAWSNKDNTIVGASVTYVDLTKDFYEVNDTMYLLPDDSNYLEDTGFVSAGVSDSTGYFSVTPYIQYQFDNKYRFYALYCDFGGAAPLKMTLKTFNGSVLQEVVNFTNLENENILYHNFKLFDKAIVYFDKGKPHSRIVLNKFGFSELSDYVLSKSDMMEQAVGYKDQAVKSVSVKQYTYEYEESTTIEDATDTTEDSDTSSIDDSEVGYQEVDDDVWQTVTIGNKGINIKIENPLIHTEEHAKKVAEWVANYYKNNIYYDVKYRGEPRLEPLDVIKMQSDVIDNLQVEIEEAKLSYNGAFSGTLALHKVN